MHAKHIFNEAKERKINYGALTQDWDFELPFEKQPGYEKIMRWLEKQVKKDYIKQGYMDAIARDLKNPSNFEIPQMVETFEKYKNIPWVDGDTKAVGYDAARLGGFSYRKGRQEWEKAIYTLYRPRLDFIGEWWMRWDLKVIPTTSGR